MLQSIYLNKNNGKSYNMNKNNLDSRDEVIFIELAVIFSYNLGNIYITDPSEFSGLTSDYRCTRFYCQHLKIAQG